MATGTLDINATTTDISGTLAVGGTVTLNDDVTIIQNKKIYFDSADTYIYADTSGAEKLYVGADDDIILQPDDDLIVQAGTTEYVRFDGANQRVGIGTTNDYGRLSITSATSERPLGIRRPDGGQLIRWNIDSQIAGGITSSGGVGCGTGIYGGSVETESHLFLKSDGNVGIGHSSPNARLHIDTDSENGDILLSQASEDSGTQSIKWAASDDLVRAYIGYTISSSGTGSDGGLTYSTIYGNHTFKGQGGATLMTIDGYSTGIGNVGIGTANPGNPLAVNRSGDGVIVDFESADAVEGTVSISGATTSYNAFVGSHYTQLKDGQSDLPVGSVVMSTGEIITCNLVTEAIEAVAAVEAVEAVYETVTKQRQKVVVTEVAKEQTSTEIVLEGGKYVQKTTTKTVANEVSTPQYEEVKLYDEAGEEIGTYKIPVMEDYKEEVLVSRAIEAVEGVAAVPATTTNVPNKEYFTYINTTTTASDPAVYGTWMGKMSDDATGHSFGDDAKPIYLVAQVGLYKIRVTDTNGNISKGDYLESSTRAMEGQKQTSTAKVNSTIGKAMIAVDWSSVSTDSDLGYKWKLIPCTF
jgi:hypothetical protein